MGMLYEYEGMYKMEQEYVMVCVVCGHTLSVEDWESLPDEVCCPECGVSKNDYVKTAL